MKIKIGEWDITGETGDWIVARIYVGKKDCKEKKSDKRYYGRLHQALLFILNHNLQLQEVTDVKELLSVIRKEASEIRESADKVEKLLKEALNKSGGN